MSPSEILLGNLSIPSLIDDSRTNTFQAEGDHNLSSVELTRDWRETMFVVKSFL